MTCKHWFARVGFWVVLVGLVAQAGRADVLPFDYQEDFDDFGKTPNACPVTNPKGICAAVAAINSFIFLENMYPEGYGNNLTPNVVGPSGNETDPIDANAFGVSGWTVPPNPPRQGYYPLPGSVGGTYIQTKMNWIGDHNPGTITIFDSWFAGSPDNNRVPTIADLASQLMPSSPEDVELFINGGTGGNHALTLTGLSCEGDNYTDCFISYQDPNDPTVNNTESVSVVNGSLQIDDGFGNIYAAFSESPIPEPTSLILLGTVIAGVAWRLRRRTA
jgi:hypothetical protein